MEQYTFVRLHAREGEESAVEEALREVAGPTREEAGCLSFHTFRSMRDRRLFFIHSRWVDEAALQVHAGLAHGEGIGRGEHGQDSSHAKCASDGAKVAVPENFKNRWVCATREQSSEAERDCLGQKKTEGRAEARPLDGRKS